MWRASRAVRLVSVGLISGIALVVTSSGGVQGAGAQVSGQDQLTIRVSVVGDAPGGFTVYESCLPDEAVPPPMPVYAYKFGFDAAGHPTTAYAPQLTPAIVGDAWVVPFGPGPAAVTCRFAQVADSVPASVSWSCASTVSPEPPAVNPDPSAPATFGCLSATGSGDDPLLFTLYDAPGNEPPQVYTQHVDVRFANTYVAQPVVIAPGFTG